MEVVPPFSWKEECQKLQAQSAVLQQAAYNAGLQLQETHQQIAQLQSVNRELMEYLERLEYSFQVAKDTYEDLLSEREHHMRSIEDLECRNNELNSEFDFVSSQLESFQLSSQEKSEE